MRRSLGDERSSFTVMKFLYALVVVLGFASHRQMASSQSQYSDEQLAAFCNERQCEGDGACEIVESPYLLFPVTHCRPPEDRQPERFCGTAGLRVIGGDPLNCQTRDELFQIASSECREGTYAAAFEALETCLDDSSSGELLYRFAQFSCCPVPEESASGSGVLPTQSGFPPVDTGSASALPTDFTSEPSQSGSAGFQSESTSEAPTSLCKPSEFECSTSSECIRSDYRCDGLTDCTDGSDETNCDCVVEKFKCNSNERILFSSRCDGVSDCVNGTDEANCVCNANRFTCSDGTCVRRNFICDGDTDCPDASDERNCEGIACRVNSHFRCPCSGVCISPVLLCDGKDDCGNNADELTENCQFSSPGPNLAVDIGDTKTDTQRDISIASKFVMAIAGTLCCVGVVLLVVYIKRRRNEQYKSLKSVHVEDVKPETLSFRNSTWCDDNHDDNTELIMRDDDETLLTSKGSTATEEGHFVGYTNLVYSDTFVSDDGVKFHKDSDDCCPDDLIV